MFLSLVLFMIINMGQLCDCNEPINPYSLQHEEGQFQADDIVYINCNFCGASNPVEVITVDEDGKPAIVRIPLPEDLEDEKVEKRSTSYKEQTIKIILPKKAMKKEAVKLPTPQGLKIY